MALVGKVGRKRVRARLATTVLYGVLSLGALTTVYPFLLMLSTGFKGATDQDDGHFIPEYWTVFDQKNALGQPSKEALLGKYLLDKYGGDQIRVDGTRIGGLATNAEVAAYEQFLSSLSPDYFMAGFRTAIGQVTGRLAERYQAWLRTRYRNIDDLNRAYFEQDMAFQTVAPPPESLDRKEWRPPTDRKYREWLVFKRQLPAEFRIPVRAQWMYQEFLRSKYRNQFGSVPEVAKGGAKNFEQVALPRSEVFATLFRKSGLPQRYQQQTAEQIWSKYAKGPMPIDAYERGFVAANAGEIRREFAGRNYAYVANYIAINGSALWNTLIFCALAILTQLIVNPLAAYALSRYPIRASGKVLLFLLATMAFPAEVTMIPSFLLLKGLGLLNTFAALILPGVASGYMIFLLKGFFDSLPQELFEAGQIDGARETTMMMRIALPLSKPVLGYMALMAFMGAYGAFMYAFLVAQDQRIWTLMVWIYSLQGYAPKAVIMAALAVAALPTLVVFLFAQNVIMKGIILPGER